MTDAKLIRSAADGDTGAMEQVIRELAPNVYAYLAGMLGDDREAEEGLQETFVRVARAVGRYDKGTDPEAWVFGIARRVAMDLRPTPASPPFEFPPDSGDAGEWVRRSLRALPVELREALVCQRILGWDNARISAVLGITPEEAAHGTLQARTQLAEGMRGFSYS